MAGRVPLDPVEAILLIDASPSMAGPATGRMGPAAAALLASLPRGSRVRVLAFAARAEAIVERPTPPSEVPLDRVRTARERGLGSATRLEAAWPTLRAWLSEPSSLPKQVIWLGDGGLTEGPELAETLREIGRLGAPQGRSPQAAASWGILNLADRPMRPALAHVVEALGARSAQAGEEADRWASGHGRDPLFSRIYGLLAPELAPSLELSMGRRRLSLGALRAGEEVVWEGRVEGRVELSLAAASGPLRATPEAPPFTLGEALRRKLRLGAALAGSHAPLVALDPADLRVPSGEGEEARSCRTQGVFHAVSAVAGAEQPLALAATRRCDASPIPAPTPPAPPPSSGSLLAAAEAPSAGVLPAQTLRRMLRRRGIPIARDCFRADRRGRGDYLRRAVYTFTLADREVTHASVEGNLDEGLRRCLSRAMDALEVPPFAGSVVVRYPIHTASALSPPVIQLSTDTAGAIDSLVDEEGGPEEATVESPAEAPRAGAGRRRGPREEPRPAGSLPPRNSL